MKKAFIFDIDGTLALRDTRSPYDWGLVANDAVNTPVMTCLLALDAAGYEILLFSGRDEVCRYHTEYWLFWHEIPYTDLFMRPEGNCEPDHMIKARMLSSAKQQGYEVLGVFDDRKQVKRMWVEQGIFVFDVNQTDVEF